MKQRKLIDLNSKISVEALFNDEKVEVSFKIGKKDYRIVDEEVRQLRDWLTQEVLNEKNDSKVPLNLLNKVPEIIRVPVSLNGPTASGPLDLRSPEAKAQLTETDLDKRRAIVSSGQQAKVYPVEPTVKITKADGMEIMNLNGRIGQAKDAFSPQNLNKDQPI